MHWAGASLFSSRNSYWGCIRQGLSFHSVYLVWPDKRSFTMKYMVKEPCQVVSNIPNEQISLAECTHYYNLWLNHNWNKLDAWGQELQSHMASLKLNHNAKLLAHSMALSMLNVAWPFINELCMWITSDIHVNAIVHPVLAFKNHRIGMNSVNKDVSVQ